MKYLRGTFCTVKPCKSILTVEIKPVEKFGFVDGMRAWTNVSHFLQMLKRSKREEIHQKMPTLAERNYTHFSAHWVTNSVLNKSTLRCLSVHSAESCCQQPVISR